MHGSAAILGPFLQRHAPVQSAKGRVGATVIAGSSSNAARRSHTCRAHDSHTRGHWPRGVQRMPHQRPGSTAAGAALASADARQGRRAARCDRVNARAGGSTPALAAPSHRRRGTKTGTPKFRFHGRPCWRLPHGPAARPEPGTRVPNAWRRPAARAATAAPSRTAGGAGPAHKRGRAHSKRGRCEDGGRGCAGGALADGRPALGERH